MNNLEKKNKKILSGNTYHEFIECLKKEFPNGDGRKRKIKK